MATTSGIKNDCMKIPGAAPDVVPRALHAGFVDVGSKVGAESTVSVIFTDGVMDGAMDGAMDGVMDEVSVVGSKDGDKLGEKVGPNDGSSDGDSEVVAVVEGAAENVGAAVGRLAWSVSIVKHVVSLSAWMHSVMGPASP